MPRAKTASATMTRPRSGTTRTRIVAVRPAGQLMWSGAPPGGTTFEMYQAASGWQFFKVVTSGGTITRALIKPRDAELMICFQAYLMQHPPHEMANRSVARTRANAIPANGIASTASTGTVVTRRRVARRVSVNRSAVAAT